MAASRLLIRALTALTIPLVAACGGGPAPTSPTPPATPSVANAYILPGAVDLGANEPVVIYKGERMRWLNADSVEHDIVADTGSLPEFMTTGVLVPGGERSFVMNTVGTTTIHCTIHPHMVGTLVVREP